MELNCKGKVNFNDFELKNPDTILNELETVLFPKREDLSHVEIKLFGCPIPGAIAILNSKHFINCMEMSLNQFHRKEKFNYRNQSSTRNKDTNFHSLRKDVCDFVTYVRLYLNSIKLDSFSLTEIRDEIEEDLEELLSVIRRFFSRLYSTSDTIFHYAASHLGNKCLQPEFHVFHIHLELRWLFVTLIHARSTCLLFTEDQGGELDQTFELVMNDLVYMAMKVFARIPLSELKLKTPYSCTCVRDLWLMLQILIDDFAEKRNSKNFWDYTNLIVNDVLLKTERAKATWIAKVENSLPDCKNLELFSIWFIYHLTLLYRYNNDGTYSPLHSDRVVRENYEQVEIILKVFVDKGGKEGNRDQIDEELKIMIPLLRTITMDLWQPKIHIISFLWDCFHRRLDQPFLLQTSGPWFLSFEKKTPSELLKQIEERLVNDLESKESSYGMFLRFLGKFLRKNQNEPRFWNKMKGKLFSKLTRDKVGALSESGMFNFISLFLTLAVTVDTESVCSVMFNLLPSIPEWTNIDAKKCNLIWKGELAVLLLFKEQKRNYFKLSENFTGVVNLISCSKDEISRSMMVSYVDVLNSILAESEEFDKGEHLLIGGWIDRFFLECSRNTLGILSQSLVNVFEKCDQLTKTDPNLAGVKLMLEALWTHVACRVRQLVFDPSLIGDQYLNFTKLAAAFTIEAIRDPVTAKKHKHSAASLFQHYTSINVKDVRMFRSYLVLILKNDFAVQVLRTDVKNFDSIIIQVWIRSSILSFPLEGSDLKYLTNYIQRLEGIRQIFPTSLDIREFQECREPINNYIMAVATKRNTLKTEQERLQFDLKFKAYLSNIDKWILIPVNEENIESELSFWIYRCIGTLLICCSPIMYNRNQPNSMLKLLINKVALPAENSPLSYVKTVAKRIFSLIILGLENLNAQSDMMLQALIRDLFDHYLPLLITQSHGNNYKVSESLLRVFSEAKIEFCLLLFKKLADHFIVIPSENTTHKHCFLVMILLRNLIKGGNAYLKHVTDLIVSTCAPNVISCYIRVHSMHPHRQQTMDFLQDILSNPYYKQNSELSEALSRVIWSSVQKYLLTSVKTSFEFLISLVKIDPKVVRSLLPQIEGIIADYEKNKRQSAGALRFWLSQLKGKVDKPR